MTRRIFRQVSLSTPESVELEFVLAGIGNRALALFVDYTLLWIGQGLFWVIIATFFSGLVSTLENAGLNFAGLETWLIAISLLLSFALFSGYFAIFETLWQGQTPGKRYAKIRVIRDDGRPIGVTQATLRALLRPIDDLFFIVGSLSILINSKEKRLGDMVAGTIVVQEEKGDRREKLIIAPASEELAAKLPEMTNIANLSPDDFAVISSYLKQRPQMEAKARTDLSLKLARQLRTIVGLETIPPGTTSDHFLEAVYLAYQQQVGDVSDSFS
ncbi:MAG TPA: RDD family protein [Leptolyngbyaceae cyanobacterium M33_DOE_097]|uniref:RDD family protein n=1 Tax=Oscillatoriales cyanobacterium SpSt-418 TaxID=2282169 RepID=A0A7C3PCU5_9CYAN|nr:RDD family protein [Leptolyngbyaceae cyanobacterium M33_DOE_097]